MSKIFEYILNNGKKLYFDNMSAQFGIGSSVPEFTPVFADENLMSLRLEISHKCNGYCKYCIVYGNDVASFETLDIRDTWGWLNGQEWFCNIVDLFILGGEPLLFWDELKFILENFSGTISFSTNATMITEEMAFELAEYNVIVYVSLDGPGSEHNKNRCYRNGKEMYLDVIHGLDLLEKAGAKKGLFMVATLDTVDNIGEILVDFSHKYNFQRIGYSLPHWTKNEPELVTAEQYQKALCDIYNHRFDIDASIMQLKWRLDPLCEGISKRFACCLHTLQTTLLPDRSIVRCSKIDKDEVLHNISNEDLTNNCPIEKAKKGDITCGNCVALSCCGGGCPFDGLRRFGTIIDQRECVITPVIIQKAIDSVIEYFNCGNGLFEDGIIAPGQIKKILLGE